MKKSIYFRYNPFRMINASKSSNFPSHNGKGIDSANLQDHTGTKRRRKQSPPTAILPLLKDRENNERMQQVATVVAECMSHQVNLKESNGVTLRFNGVPGYYINSVVNIHSNYSVIGSTYLAKSLFGAIRSILQKFQEEQRRITEMSESKRSALMKELGEKVSVIEGNISASRRFINLATEKLRQEMDETKVESMSKRILEISEEMNVYEAEKKEILEQMGKLSVSNKTIVMSDEQKDEIHSIVFTMYVFDNNVIRNGNEEQRAFARKFYDILRSKVCPLEVSREQQELRKQAAEEKALELAIAEEECRKQRVNEEIESLKNQLNEMIASANRDREEKKAIDDKFMEARRSFFSPTQMPDGSLLTCHVCWLHLINLCGIVQIPCNTVVPQQVQTVFDYVSSNACAKLTLFAEYAEHIKKVGSVSEKCLKLVKSRQKVPKEMRVWENSAKFAIWFDVNMTNLQNDAEDARNAFLSGEEEMRQKIASVEQRIIQIASTGTGEEETKVEQQPSVITSKFIESITSGNVDNDKGVKKDATHVPSIKSTYVFPMAVGAHRVEIEDVTGSDYAEQAEKSAVEFVDEYKVEELRIKKVLEDDLLERCKWIFHNKTSFNDRYNGKLGLWEECEKKAKKEQSEAISSGKFNPETHVPIDRIPLCRLTRNTTNNIKNKTTAMLRARRYPNHFRVGDDGILETITPESVVKDTLGEFLYSCHQVAIATKYF
jgi:hypothetical protein